MSWLLTFCKISELPFLSIFYFLGGEVEKLTRNEDILEEIKKKQLNYQGKVRVRLSKKLK
jgi:hypothetical protein